MNPSDIKAVSESMPPAGGHIEGASPLVGHLSLASLLVREAVQNAWDARDPERGNRPVRFGIDGRSLRPAEVDHLRSLLPVGQLGGFERLSPTDDGSGPIHPRYFLEQGEVDILVVSDRNTMGLCGPTRGGVNWIEPVRRGSPLPAELAQQRFALFVRKSGRPAQSIGRGAGGSYGVGKNALWMASRCGTILVHTRTTDTNGHPVERFIGIVHGLHHYDGPNEFTGRHFIGLPAKTDDGGMVVEPLVGSAAHDGVAGLPHPSYSEGGEVVDGTTVFIIAPNRSFLTWDLEMKVMADAVRWQVWPKRVPGARIDAGGPDMEIEIRSNGKLVSLPGPLEDPELRPYACALLDAVNDRDDDSGEAFRDASIDSGSPRHHLGYVRFRNGGKPDDNAMHLTYTAARLQALVGNDGVRDASYDSDVAVDFERPWGQIALIRREPLLLVRYEPLPGADVVAQEVGVFLSANDKLVESVLTSAEPPAHDEWIPSSVTKDGGQRTLVNMALRRIKAAGKDLAVGLADAAGTPTGRGSRQLAARVSAGWGGSGGKRRKRTPGPTGAHTGPHAELQISASTPIGDGVEHEINVRFEGSFQPGNRYRCTAQLKGRDSAGALDVDTLADIRWASEKGGPILELVADDHGLPNAQLVATTERDLRLRPTVKIEEIADHAD